jgi:Flp pilus assembly CpaE family ATPase
MLIALASLKSSPGVTTSALALAGFWPGARQTCLVEADPAGGDVRSWYQIPGEPGLAGLATEARHRDDPGLLAAHAAELPGGLRVVTAPEGPDQARAAVELLARDGAGLLRALAAAHTVTLVDLGRLGAASPSADLLPHADVLLLLARPSLAEITRLASRIETIKAQARQDAQVGLLLRGRGYPPAEIETALRTPVLATLPRDESCAAVLSGRAAAARRGLAYTALARAARALGKALDQPTDPAADPIASHAEIPVLKEAAV